MTNHSKVHVEKLKFALNKIIDYNSKSPGLAIKREIHRLLKKEAGGVGRKTEQRYEHVIDVPMMIPPSQDSKTSRLIHIKYELKVEAKLGGLYKNLIISVPLTVGNVPHSINARSQPVFPQLPDLPSGLTVRMPSASIDSDIRRLSMSSIPSFRSVPNSSQSDSNASSFRSSMHDHSMSSVPRMPNSSLGSAHTVNLSQSTQNVSTGTEFQPSAPPMDLSTANTSTPIRPATIYIMDAPPSYDEVFGEPSTSFPNCSNSSLYNRSIAKT